jgi:hypothetical protein
VTLYLFWPVFVLDLDSSPHCAELTGQQQLPGEEKRNKGWGREKRGREMVGLAGENRQGRGSCLFIQEWWPLTP